MNYSNRKIFLSSFKKWDIIHVLYVQEILEMVTVRNLDTGEMMPLSVAEDRLPQCVNPLSLHIMRRTKEYSRFGCYCLKI